MGKDNKLHIILLGRRNSGKKHADKCRQVMNIAIVSDVAWNHYRPREKKL